MHSPERQERAGVVSDTEVLIQGYSNYLAALQKSPRTVGEYTLDVRRWAAWWKRPVEFFNQDEWDDWTAHLHQSGVSGKSVRRYQCSLKRFFKYLRRRKVCANEPAKDCEVVGIRKKLPVFLMEDEVDRLIAAAESPRFRAMLELMYSCGLRNEECRELKMAQVGASHLQLFGKGNKERVVPLKPKTRQVLDEWLKERASESEYVFPDYQGGRLFQSVVARGMRRALKRANIVKRATPHSLRHSIATHLAMRSVPVEQIQIFLGHDRIETTMTYVHLAKQLTQTALLQAHPRC